MFKGHYCQLHRAHDAVIFCAPAADLRKIQVSQGRLEPFFLTIERTAAGLDADDALLTPFTETTVLWTRMLKVDSFPFANMEKMFFWNGRDSVATPVFPLLVGILVGQCPAPLGVHTPKP